MLGPPDLLFALLTGVGVVAITLLGDRLGGRLGGLLATAPVTTSAAHVLIATSVAPGLAAGKVLQGVAAMLASTFGIVAFFYAVKYTRGRPSDARLAAGLAVYVSAFLALTFIFATYPLHPVSAFVILFALHATLAFTFMREPVPILKDATASKRARRSALELAGRFAAGAAVVLVIRVLLDVYPPFAGALAVVPAVFLVSLTVMGVSHDAPFAARAAQAGLFGTTAVAVFVLTIAAGLHLRLPGGIWPLLPAGWAAYALTLAALGRLHGRIAR